MGSTTACAPPPRFTETPLPDARPVQVKACWEEKKRLELYGRLMPRAVAVRWMIRHQPTPAPASPSKP